MSDEMLPKWYDRWCLPKDLPELCECGRVFLKDPPCEKCENICECGGLRPNCKCEPEYYEER